MIQGTSIPNPADPCEQMQNKVDVCAQIDTNGTQPDSRDVLAWQPIETAPKDGTIILLFWAGSDGAYDVGCWHAGHWRESVEDEGHWGEPSYWQNLPKAPRLEEGRR